MKQEPLKDKELLLLKHLKGLVHSLENGFMDSEAVYGTMLIHLYSGGYLKKKEEHYVKVMR